MSTLTATIQLRSDTEANWTSSNPILKSTELGIEIDTFTTSGTTRLFKCKLGDGSTAWNSLSYANIGQFFAGGSSSASFSSLTGVPSDNSALQAALDLKANLSSLPYDISSYRKIGSTVFKRYYTQAINSVAAGSSTQGRNFANYIPLIIGKTTTLSEIGMEITAAGTAGSLVRICIYSSLNGLPDQLILNAGTILADSATPQLITGLSTVLTPGMYFLYVNSDSVSNFTFRGITPTGTYMLLGYTNAMGTTAANYYRAVQTYTATPPTTALAPTDAITGVSQPAFFMYFSS